MKFCIRYRYWLLLVVLAFSAAGSVLGASVESVLWEDTLTDIPAGATPGIDVPYMSEIFGLAGEQSLWMSFRYAAGWGAAGIAAALVLAAFLYRCRERSCFRVLDQVLHDDT